MVEVTHWYWWIFAGLLLVLELAIPGTFFLWLGIGAILVGFLVLLFNISFQAQVLFFAGGIIFSILLARAYLKNHPIKSDQPLLNSRGAEYIGRIFTLTEDVVNGIGRVRVGDSYWRVEGPDAPQGTQVRVIAVEGVRLKVEPLAHDD